MSDFLRLLISLSLSGGALTLLTALLNRILKDRMPRTFLYYLWLPVLVRFLLPVGMDWSLANRLVSPPRTVKEETAPPDVTAPAITPSDPAVITSNISQAPSILDTTDITNTMDNAEPIVSAAPKQESAAIRMPSLPVILTAVWALGVLLCVIWRFYCYWRLNRSLWRNKQSVNKWECELLRTLTTEKGICPVLRRSGAVHGPMLIGLLRPVIWLPKETLDAVDLSHALRHELTHWRRHDLWLKWMAVLTVCLHWFNPAAWYLIYALDRDCELSCDEQVVMGLSEQERTGYGELLLHCAVGAPSARSLFVPFANQKRMMKERMQTIVRKNPDSRKARILLAVAVAAVVLSGTALGAYTLQAKSNPGTSDPADTRDPSDGEDTANHDGADADTGDEDNTDLSAPMDYALGTYREILLGNAWFYNTESGQRNDIKKILNFNDSTYLERFTVLDRDGDGILDAVAVAGSKSLLLYWQDDTVYGTLSKEEFDNAVEVREGLPDPIWYDFTEENVKKVFPITWLTAENELQFPFNLATEYYSSTEEHVVPKEALQAATTESLLRAVKQYSAHFARYWLYDFPSYYLMAAERFNATEELVQRVNLAKVLLAAYEEENLEKEDEVVLGEILLATNLVFEQTDEEMREQILAAVMEKEYMRRTGTDTADHPSGFLAYITEMKETDASLWYAYIMEEASDASAKACLEDYEGSFYWPYKD